MRIRRTISESSGSRVVVGLDISLRAPGVCVSSGDPSSEVGQGLFVESAVVRAGEDLKGPERLSVVSRSIWSWLAARGCGRPGDLVVVEGYAFSRSHAHSLGELGGCVRRMVWEAGCNLLVVPPSTLKKYLTGKGAGDKSAVIKHVYKRWAFDVDDDDQCDAFGCSMLGLVDRTPESGWSALEKDILKKKVMRFAGKGQTGWCAQSVGRRK